MPVCLPGWETLSDDWHPCVLFILAHRVTRTQKQNHKKNFLQLPLSKLSRFLETGADRFLDPVNDLKLPVVVTATFACDYYHLDCYFFFISFIYCPCCPLWTNMDVYVTIAMVRTLFTPVKGGLSNWDSPPTNKLLNSHVFSSSVLRHHNRRKPGHTLDTS